MATYLEIHGWFLTDIFPSQYDVQELPFKISKAYLAFFLGKGRRRIQIDAMLLLLTPLGSHGGVKSESLLVAARIEAFVDADLREDREAWMESTVVDVRSVELVLAVQTFQGERPCDNPPEDCPIVK